MADAPNVFWVPIFLLFGGVGRSPQEITTVRWWGDEKHDRQRVGEKENEKWREGLPYIFKVNERAAVYVFLPDLNAMRLTCNTSRGA